MKGKRNEHMDTCIKNEILITIYQVCVQQCFANLKPRIFVFNPVFFPTEICIKLSLHTSVIYSL